MTKHMHQPQPNHPAHATPENPEAHAAPLSGPFVATVPSHADIAQRAYAIYVKTGRKQGQCTQNWQQAEQSLRGQKYAICQAQKSCSQAAALHPTVTR